MNYKKRHKEKIRYSYYEGSLSFLLNILIFGLKYWAGVVSGSVALIADAWHTLMHSVSSIILLVGAKISSRPADEKHPFGYGRAELLSAILLGVSLAVVAFEFFHRSVEVLTEKSKTNFGTLAIVVLIISIVLKFALWQYAFWASKKTSSDAIRADGLHHRSDVFITLIILIGVFVGKYFWWMDGTLGILISLLIVYSAYQILKNAFQKVLGERPDPDFVKKLKTYCREIYPADLGLHHIHLHRYGDHVEMTCHIRLPSDMSLEKTNEIVTKIENYLEKNGVHATIHAEPQSGDCREVN